MKIPQYTKYSGISISLAGTKSSAWNRKKEFLEDAMKSPRCGWPDRIGDFSEKKRGKKMKKNDVIYLSILYLSGFKK